ncbi:MAG: polyhydroxyalkanoic acid system protein [Caulobacter sp.]|nr:polyhydroxyalkanoic acid system protein [Caulobacter sp.]
MAKPLTITIAHQLGQAEARKRIEEGFGKIEQQLAGGGQAKVDKSWTGDTMNFTALAMGQTITGALHVLDDSIKLDIVLPGFLSMFAGKVKEKVEKEGQLLLEKK